MRIFCRVSIERDFTVPRQVCLSISSHHPEHWQPSWSVRTALTALIAFMPTPGNGAIGSLVRGRVPMPMKTCQIALTLRYISRIVADLIFIFAFFHNFLRYTYHVWCRLYGFLFCCALGPCHNASAWRPGPECIVEGACRSLLCVSLMCACVRVQRRHIGDAHSRSQQG